MKEILCSYFDLPILLIKSLEVGSEGTSGIVLLKIEETKDDKENRH